MGNGLQRLRAAIIGSGVAGAFAAHFLRARLGDRAEITVLEGGDRVGGRVLGIEVAGERLEAGASAIHSANSYLVQAIATLRLTDTLAAVRSPSHGSSVGIWNGEGFDVVIPPGGKGFQALLERYGDSVLKAQALARQTLEKFVQIYELQEAGEAFATPKELLQRLGLYDLSQIDTYTVLRDHGVGDRFALEISDAFHRGNYGQSSRLNALAGLVSFIGYGMDGGRVFGVAEGNSRLVEGVLEHAGASICLRTRVGALRRGRGREGVGRYLVTTEDGQELRFDAVIVAAPLESAGIAFGDGALHERVRRDRPYQTTHVTFVVGQLNPGYFGLNDDHELPGLVLTREEPVIPFSSVGKRPTARGVGVYKMFSRTAVDDGLLERLFLRRTATRRLLWQAYPVLAPTADWPPFRLAPGLYYINAMESAVSTMESEAVAARNVVNLLVQELGA